MEDLFKTFLKRNHSRGMIYDRSKIASTCKEQMHFRKTRHFRVERGSLREMRKGSKNGRGFLKNVGVPTEKYSGSELSHDINGQKKYGKAGIRHITLLTVSSN